jgi:hypothetical protein
MPNAIETYIRAWSERDAAVRARMLEACFAADGRFVTTGREICGRAALADEMTRLLADPRLVAVRLTSAIDARGKIFRFRGRAEFSDGTSAESFDAGVLDSDGRISLLLTFAGPLGDVEDGSARDHQAAATPAAAMPE